MPTPEERSTEHGGTVPDREAEREGHDRALELLRACATEHGFVASLERKDNYRRVWGRDGSIMGLAALASGEPDLVGTLERTLDTLARHQGPHGEIPSNVDAATGEVSYGGTAGRVDADLWFGIALGQYGRVTEDREVLRRLWPAVERARFLLGAWEFNHRGLLYVPQTGDWSDEYVQSGYVLYDQLLYLQFQREVDFLARTLGESLPDGAEDRRRRLVALIRTNYWLDPDRLDGEAVYHHVLYEKGRRAAPRCAARHWMPFFWPLGYGYRFDALANVLTSLVRVADDAQSARVDGYIDDELVPDELPLLPAFHPVITPVDEDWEDLQATFSYTFKNEPYEFHNGGLWPMVTGFHVASLALRGRKRAARRFLDGIHRANALPYEDGEPWSFPEYVHGRELTPGGTRGQGWSAAAAVIGEAAVRGVPILRGDEHEQDAPLPSFEPSAGDRPDDASTT